jgi:ketosteroid isomerase-like protein
MEATAMPNTATHASDVDMLQELNRHYIRSVRESDVRWFDENLAEDFVNSNPDCSFVDRAGFLAQIARPSAVKNIQCEDVRIQMLGEVAIIRARTTYIKPDGQPGAGRYTDVWAHRGARWLCVAANVSRG